MYIDVDQIRSERLRYAPVKEVKEAMTMDQPWTFGDGSLPRLVVCDQLGRCFVFEDVSEDDQHHWTRRKAERGEKERN